MPRTEEQYKAMREKSRNLILQTALKLFAKKGYQGTSVADIAKEAGISKGLAYNYFKSKKELIEAVIGLLSVEVAEMFVGMEKITDPYEKIQLVIEETIKTIVDRTDFWVLYFGLTIQKEVLEISQDIMGNMIEEMIKILEMIFREIGIEKPAEEARIFGAILDGVGLHFMYETEIYPLEQVKNQLLSRYSKEGLKPFLKSE